MGTPVGVIMADLDHFKQINDTHGHLAGDAVLRNAAQRMRASLRWYDLMGRYGGEEFLVVLPECDIPSTVSLANRLRESISGQILPLPEGKTVLMTLSLGVSSTSEAHPPEAAALLRVADAALYCARRPAATAWKWAHLHFLAITGAEPYSSPLVLWAR